MSLIMYIVHGPKGKYVKQKVGLKISEKIHKNREKNLQFYGGKQSKIRWTVVEIKFIKDEKFFQIRQMQNQKFGLKNLGRYLKIEKKICNFMV